MAYTEKFQALADAARTRVAAVSPSQVDAIVAAGGVLLDIRDKEEFDVDHIPTARNVSRGTLEMNVESIVPDLEAVIVCYCNANNRGALSADTLRAMGYRNVRYIAGGRKAYRASSAA